MHETIQVGAVAFAAYDRSDYRKQHLFAVAAEDGGPFRLVGEQVGAGFGAALAVLDIDSDGLGDEHGSDCRSEQI